MEGHHLLGSATGVAATRQAVLLLHPAHPPASLPAQEKTGRQYDFYCLQYRAAVPPPQYSTVQSSCTAAVQNNTVVLLYLYCAMKPSWNFLNSCTNSAIFSSRGRMVVRRWKVPSAWPKPLPGTVLMPVSSSSLRQ